MSTKKEVQRYVSLVFFFSYSCWFLAAMLTHLGDYPLFSAGPMIPYILGTTGPLIGSLVVSKCSQPKDAYQAFRKTIYNVKQPIVGYVVTLILAWLICFLPALLNGSKTQAPFFSALQQLPVMIFFGGGLEEVGWRGFLQPRLQKSYSRFVSTCIIAVVWTCWHLPLWFIKGSGQDTTSLFWFTIVVFSMSFLLTIIWNRFQSISLCILFHAACNAFTDVYVSNHRILPSVIVLLVCMTLFVIDEKKGGRTPEN